MLVEVFEISDSPEKNGVSAMGTSGDIWGFENPLAFFGWNGVLHFQRYTSRYTPR
jgi:hypothetical protein